MTRYDRAGQEGSQSVFSIILGLWIFGRFIEFFSSSYLFNKLICQRCFLFKVGEQIEMFCGAHSCNPGSPTNQHVFKEML